MPSKINPLIMIFYSLLLLQTSTKSRMKQGFDCRYEEVSTGSVA
jgi:hypothetical protein